MNLEHKTSTGQRNTYNGNESWRVGDELPARLEVVAARMRACPSVSAVNHAVALHLYDEISRLVASLEHLAAQPKPHNEGGKT